MKPKQLQQILEGALLCANKELSMSQINQLFDGDLERPSREDIQKALEALEKQCKSRGYQLKKVASGYRFQVRESIAPWVSRMWEEKPQKYSRAFLETLAIIAYRQPMTRGDIEEIRGVAVSSNIIKTLMERDWVRIIGHRDVPGRPALLATTKGFLDYFNLQRLQDLPPLAEIKEFADLHPELKFDMEPDNFKTIPQQQDMVADDEDKNEPVPQVNELKLNAVAE